MVLNWPVFEKVREYVISALVGVEAESLLLASRLPFEIDGCPTVERTVVKHNKINHS